jgi:hypothetical protein
MGPVSAEPDAGPPSGVLPLAAGVGDRCAEEAEEVEGDRAEEGCVLRAVGGTHPGGVLAEGGIADVVQGLDSPVTPGVLADLERVDRGRRDAGGDEHGLPGLLSGGALVAVPDDPGDLPQVQEVEIVPGHDLLLLRFRDVRAGHAGRPAFLLGVRGLSPGKMQYPLASVRSDFEKLTLFCCVAREHGMAPRAIAKSSDPGSLRP